MFSIENNSKAQTQASQVAINPDMALELLLKGNQRFLDSKLLDRDLHDQIQKTAKGQYPFAVVVSCIDSRIPTEVIFDQGIGDIFNVRIAGNFINDDILGSLEFSCKLAGAKLIMVLGHTSCGAVKGACDQAELGHLTQMLEKINPAVENTKTEPGVDRSSKNTQFVNRVAEENVKLNLQRIKDESPVLGEMIENGAIELQGAMYDVTSGKVSLL